MRRGTGMNSLITVEKAKADEEKFMNEIITTRGGCLPDKVEDVISIFEFTDFKAKAFKMLSDKIKNIEDQADLYQSAQRSAQKWSITSLYAQKRMGELTREVPAEKNPRNISFMADGVNEKRSYLNADGNKGKLTHRVWADAETIAKHPDVLDRVVERAKDKNEIPTKSAVLNTIRIERQKEINTRAKRKGDAKIVNETTTATKDYYDQLKGFKTSIDLAIKNAEVGKFAPEGKNFMIKKHNEIRSLLKQLEELL
jgi:hypothetical protein